MKKKKYENIGQAIRVLRTAAGMKQKKLAEFVGIKPNSLSLIESGKREPSLSVLRSIAKALDVPVSLLFWESQDHSRGKNLKVTTLLGNIRYQLLELEGLRLAEHAAMYKQKNGSK